MIRTVRQIKDLWVCTDCLMFIANGYLTEDDELNEAIVAGCERQLPYRWYTENEEGSFSWRSCACCWSKLGGDRYKAGLVFVCDGTRWTFKRDEYVYERDCPESLAGVIRRLHNWRTGRGVSWDCLNYRHTRRTARSWGKTA